jgi:DNA repair protein RecO (recombination protein O)
MTAYKTRAISLKTVPFAEADKLATLFTREHGKIKAIAKGARRVPSRFGGRVETFTYADYFIAQGRSLDIISQCQVIESFQKIRENSQALPAGLYLLKLVNSGTAEGQVYIELFDLLLQSLTQLKNKQDARRVVKDFLHGFVMIEGIFKEGIDPQYSLSEHIGEDFRKW